MCGCASRKDSSLDEALVSPTPVTQTGASAKAPDRMPAGASRFIGAAITINDRSPLAS